jgi:hypothetical protein
MSVSHGRSSLAGMHRRTRIVSPADKPWPGVILALSGNLTLGPIPPSCNLMMMMTSRPCPENQLKPPMQPEVAMIYLADLKLPKIESPEFSRFPITSLPIVLILLLFIGESTIVLLSASVSYACA